MELLNSHVIEHLHRQIHFIRISVQSVAGSELQIYVKTSSSALDAKVNQE